MITLKLGDEVKFIVNSVTITYIVHENFLHNSGGGLNSLIFREIGVNKKDFCRVAYGYETSVGDWPYFHNGDFAAASRCVEALAREVYMEGGKTLVNGHDLYDVSCHSEFGDFKPNFYYEFLKEARREVKKVNLSLIAKKLLDRNLRILIKKGILDDCLRVKDPAFVLEFIVMKFKDELAEIAIAKKKGKKK